MVLGYGKFIKYILYYIGWWKWIILFIYFVIECMIILVLRDRGFCKRIVLYFIID